MKFFTISFLLALIALCAVLYFLPGKITSAVHTTSSEGYGVAATTYPIWVLTREVLDGTGIEAELLTPPDAGCPHDYVLTPNDLMITEEIPDDLRSFIPIIHGQKPHTK